MFQRTSVNELGQDSFLTNIIAKQPLSVMIIFVERRPMHKSQTYYNTHAAESL